MSDNELAFQNLFKGYNLRIQEEDTMETEQNFDKEEINPRKKQKTSPFLPLLYVKCYSKTRFDVTTFDFTWEIEQFMSLLKIVDFMESPDFPEANKYKIQMVLPLKKSDTEIQFCICMTNNTIQENDTSKQSQIIDDTFHGFCTTTLMDSCKRVISSNSIAGHIKDGALLISIPKSKLQLIDTLIIHCKFEIFVKPTTNTIHLNLYPTALKDVKPHEDSTVESDNESTIDEETIKFIVGEDQYVISKKLLRATKSTYFTHICRTHEGKEKNMTNDLITNNEIQAFKQVLLYILTGSISDQYDYDVLKTLLTAADKYDVPTLKLTCEHYLLRYITIENALELVQLAVSSNATFLETHLATFIKFHIKEITKIKEFRTLFQEDLNRILELIQKSEILKDNSFCTFVKNEN